MKGLKINLTLKGNLNFESIRGDHDKPYFRDQQPALGSRRSKADDAVSRRFSVPLASFRIVSQSFLPNEMRNGNLKTDASSAAISVLAQGIEVVFLVVFAEVRCLSMAFQGNNKT